MALPVTCASSVDQAALCDDGFVNCPNCAAPMELSLPDGSYRCRHCGTFHFPDTVDSEGIRVLGPSDPALSCPVCALPLVLALMEKQQVEYLPCLPRRAGVTQDLRRDRPSSALVGPGSTGDPDSTGAG